MKFLANENFPRLAVEALRLQGHDVLWARTDMPGTSDERILQRAQVEERIVLTFDKDFGELAFRHGLAAACGIVLFRFVIPSPESATQRIASVLASRSDWQGHFAVVEESRIRIRPLDATASEG